MEKRVAILVSQKRYKDLLPDAKALAALEPKKPQRREDLAFYTLQAGLYDEAIALFRAELKRRPKDKRAWMNVIDAIEAKKNKQ